MKMPNNPAKYEVLLKKYLRSILEICSEVWENVFERMPIAFDFPQLD